MLVNVSNAGRRGSKFADQNVGYGRQLSHNSSIRSNRSIKSSSSNLHKKIQEHKLQKDTAEWQKEQEYNVRRKRRKEMRKLLESKSRLVCVKRLFIVSILAILFGIVVTFGATIRTLGEGGVFWNYRQVFKIAGPILITMGIILLLVSVGLENSAMEDIRASGDLEEPLHFIHPDFTKEKTLFSRQYSTESSMTSENESRPGQKIERRYRKWQAPESSNGEEDFLCSSITSATNSIGTCPSAFDLTSRWARAMALTIDESGNIITNDDNRSKLPRVDSDVLRLMNNAPSIHVTDVADGSNGTVSKSNSDSSFPRSSSLNSLSKLKSNDLDIYRVESEKTIKMDGVARGLGLVVKDIKLHGISEESVSHNEHT